MYSSKIAKYISPKLQKCICQNLGIQFNTWRLFDDWRGLWQGALSAQHAHCRLQCRAPPAGWNDDMKWFWKRFRYPSGLNYYIQLAKSSLAIHGGAIFSAVCGWKSIPISAPEPYKHRECCRLLVFPPGATFFCPTHAHCFRCSVGISNGFVMKQVTWICFSDKSMWPASAQIHLKCPQSSGSSVHVNEGQKKSCSWWGKKVAYCILGTHTAQEH